MKVLFICTHNRCRSILAEAIFNESSKNIGNGRLEARSAGSQPAGQVHPLSIQALSNKGINTQGLCSESWDEHRAWQPNIVITVCDSAAQESCPTWFDGCCNLHWGLNDPSKLEGSKEDVMLAFNQLIEKIESRAKAVANIVNNSQTTISEDELSKALSLN